MALSLGPEIEWCGGLCAHICKPISYKRHRFLPEIIAHAVWLYFRFPLSLRLVEEMLLERGIVISVKVGI